MNKKGCFYSVIKAILRPLTKCVLFYKFEGMENVPRDHNFILCSNHISIFDPLLLIVAEKRKICFMAKCELFKNRILGKLFSRLGVFPVNRGKGDMTAIYKSEEIINSGGILGIFFEGTRSKTGELLRPKSGVGMIAYKTKADVVPVCILAKNGGQMRLFSRTRVIFGKPIENKEFNFQNGNSLEFRNASRRIMDSVREIRENALKNN